jgi:Chaperone of endosialidase
MGSTSKKDKSTVTVTTPEPGPDEVMARKQAQAANTLGMQQLGYTWGPGSQKIDVYNPEAAQRYINANPDIAQSLGVNGAATEEQLQGAWQHFANAGNQEGRDWSIAGPEGWQKNAPTPEEQQRASREKEIEDLAYRKLTGQITPEDRALVEQEYSSASAVGRSNIQADMQRMLDQIKQSGVEAAGARGLSAADTPIFGQVAKQQRLLGEDTGRNITNLETSLQGAKAGAMLDVGYRQQMFGQALREFQQGLQQQSFMNQQTIADAFANTALGLGNLRSRNVTQVSKGTGSAGAGAQGAGQIMGGAGGLMGGLGSMMEAFGSNSSRDFKDNIENVDLEEILADLEKMNVYTWNYKPTFKDDRRHIGPVTEESPEIVVQDKQLITQDCIGFLFATVKALHAKVRELEEK